MSSPPLSLNTVLQDLDESIPEVPVNWLLDNVVARVEFDPDAVKERLVRKGHIVRGRWSDFPRDPAASKKVEVKTFKPFESVVCKIMECAGITTHSQLLTFFDNPHRATRSHRSKLEDTRPDSYFTREGDPSRPDVSGKPVSKAPRHHWDDIALPAEYKKGATKADRDNNTEKMIWSLHHVMRTDPCRRFIFGITVENTNMRIWFASQSQVFVTTAFHFILDHLPLIRFVISCAYATEENLGWDPTIKRVYVNGAVHYDITVYQMKEGKVVEAVFRTTRILADFAADALCGRGTRVFEARSWDGITLGDTLVAIKDVWIDIDCEREGNILQELDRSATNEEDKAIFREYFVTVLAHGDVIINDQADHTLDLILRGHKVPMDSRFILKLGEQITNLPEPSIGLPVEPPLARTRHISVPYSHKMHYRLVYGEVTEPIHSVDKLADIFQALGDVSIGLEFMHRNGWVHRDVSSGNILVYQGHGKLSDLEYAKRMNSEGSRGVRTGTMNFMSVEVGAQKYIFRKRLASGTSSISSLHNIPFQYNPLHDLESLWWIGVWMMFYHRVHPTEQGDEERTAAIAQLRNYRDIFPGVLAKLNRMRALMNDYDIEERFQLLPEACHAAAEQLEVARMALVRHYRLAEAGTVIDTAAFSSIHQQLVSAFGSAKEKSGEIKLRSLVDILQVSGRPRQDHEEKRGEGSTSRAFRAPVELQKAPKEGEGGH